MDKHELDDKVEKIAKTLFSYCAARTPNLFEAEDLAQDILLELYRSAERVRSPDAFYGFMWAVAGNVYKQWLRKRRNAQVCKLTENLLDESELLPQEDSEVYLLRRELSLLSKKYRKAVVLYYIENIRSPQNQRKHGEIPAFQITTNSERRYAYGTHLRSAKLCSERAVPYVLGQWRKSVLSPLRQQNLPKHFIGLL